MFSFFILYNKMTDTQKKKEKELFKKLNSLYTRDYERITDWLNDIAIEYSGVHNGKITNILTGVKIRINTDNEYGTYSSILKWFLKNKEKFKDDAELFDSIPSTDFIKISKDVMLSSNLHQAISSTANMDDIIKQWKANPKIDPFTSKAIKVSIVNKSEYTNIYEKCLLHLCSSISQFDMKKPDVFEKIRDSLPNDHCYVFKDMDYIEKLNTIYPNADWVDFLKSHKSIFYKKETSGTCSGYTVYDHLFLHYYLIPNKDLLYTRTKELYIDYQLFLYETIEDQIKSTKAIDLDCYEIIESMTHKKDINFKVKKDLSNEWPYKIPPLLALFTEYIDEMSYYLKSISQLQTTIYDDYFLYGENISNTKYVISDSIDYNIYRLKTIVNIIIGTLCSLRETKEIKEYLDLLWQSVYDIIHHRHIYNVRHNKYDSFDIHLQVNNDLCDIDSQLNKEDIRLFFITAIFDIEILHKESNTETTYYKPIKDPYDNLPEPPKIPDKPVLSDNLSSSEKDKKLTEYKKQLKSFDKALKEYNDKYMGKRLSPFFSVTLSRAKSDVGKSGLSMLYTPTKKLNKSLTESNKEKLLEKFEKGSYGKSNRAKQKGQQDFMNYWLQSGGTGKLDDLKLNLALDANKFKKYAKQLSPSGKSPRQKYIGCNLNELDPITQKKLSDLPLKKIKYLSKITSTLDNGEKITHCYDTIPLYNYILDCHNKGTVPINLALGSVSLTEEQLKEVYKKIKYFTTEKTLDDSLKSEKIMLKYEYKERDYYSFEFYDLLGKIEVGGIKFSICWVDRSFYYGGIHKKSLFTGAIIDEDDLTTDTIKLIDEGMKNTKLIQVKKYPYHKGYSSKLYDTTKILVDLPEFRIDPPPNTLAELTKITRDFNDKLKQYVN